MENLPVILEAAYRATFPESVVGERAMASVGGKLVEAAELCQEYGDHSEFGRLLLVHGQALGYALFDAPLWPVDVVRVGSAQDPELTAGIWNSRHSANDLPEVVRWSVLTYQWQQACSNPRDNVPDVTAAIEFWRELVLDAAEIGQVIEPKIMVPMILAREAAGRLDGPTETYESILTEGSRVYPAVLPVVR